MQEQIYKPHHIKYFDRVAAYYIPGQIILFILLLPIMTSCSLNYKDETADTVYSLPQSALRLKKEGDKALRTENIDSALIYYGLVANLLQNKDIAIAERKVIADALNNMGYIQFQYYHNYLSSYRNLINALEIAEQMDYEEIYPSIYLNIANLYSSYDDQESSTEYHRKALKSAVKKNDTEIAIISLSCIIFDAIMQKDEMPSYYINEFKRLKIKPDDKMGAYIAHFIKATVYVYKGDYDRAIEEYNKAKGAVDRSHDQDSAKYSCDFLIAKILLAQGKRFEAISLLRDSFPSRSNIDPDWRIRSYKLISDTYADMSLSDSALQYQIRSTQLKDSIFRLQPFGYIKDIQTGTIVRKHEQKIGDLNESLDKTRMTLTASALIIMLIAVLLYIVIVQNRHLKKSNRMLYLRSQEELRREGIVKSLNLLEVSMQSGDITSASAQDVLSASAEPAHADLSGKDNKYKTSSLDEANKKNLIAKILKFFAESKDFYSPDFSLQNLADIIGCRPAHLSQVISECMHTNFRSLVAEARVNECCRRICDYKIYSNVTMESIAQSVGFRSRTNFITVFKRYTGLTPTEYRHQHLKN